MPAEKPSIIFASLIAASCTSMPDLGSSASTPVVVLDTNAVLDWLVFEDPRMAALGAAIEDGRVRWLATPRMRAEFVHVICRPRMARMGDSERGLTRFDHWVQPRSEPVVAVAVPLCSDPDDQVFLDLAVECGARWLVTRDKALLALHRKALALGLIVLVPGDWHARAFADQIPSSNEEGAAHAAPS